MRKTIEVKKVLDFVNCNLARDDAYASNPKFKAALCSVIENVLMESDQDNGFHFRRPELPNHPNDAEYYSRHYFMKKS